MNIGAQLTHARTAADMSLAEMSSRVRLRSSVIAAIEANDFEPCGGDVYARGHVRTIATVLGMDVDSLMADFSEQVGPSPLTLQDLVANSSFEKRPVPWTRLISVASAVIAVVVGYSIFVGSSGNTPVQSPSTTLAVDSPASTSATSDGVFVDRDRGASTDATAQTGSAVLVVVSAAKGSSWLAVTTESGTQLFSGILKKGSVQEFRDSKRLQVVIGNAAGIELTVNGKKLGSPGGYRQVLHLAFGPGDPTKG